METSPNVSKHGKDVNQSESQIPEEAGLVDDLCNSDPNANWGTEPNFNLNLNLTSPSNPRPPTETSKLHGGIKKDEGNTGGGKSGVKVTVNKEMGKWASTVKTTLMSQGERDDPTWQKSKIPALSRSPTVESSVNSRGEQRLKSPNPKHTATLSPKTHTQSSIAVSPKAHRLEQTTVASSPTTAEIFKAQRAESASVLSPKPHTPQPKSTNTVTGQKIKSNRKEDGGRESSLKTHSPQTLHVPVNPNTYGQKGNTNITSPKPTSRTPTLACKTHKPGPATTTVKSNEQASHDSRTHCETSSTIPKLQSQRAESTLLSTKTPQQSSLSPKLTMQKKVTGTRNSDTSDSKENLDIKDSSAGSLSKTSSKSSSNSKATTVTMDSLDSQSGNHLKTSPHSKTTAGSKDSLDSKSGSTSKASWGSKDSLDSKMGSSSKASPDSKAGIGSRDSLESKTTTEIKVNKASLDSKTAVGSKSGLRSKDDLDPPVSFNPKWSPTVKPGSESNFSSSSDVLSSSKPELIHVTSKPALTGSGTDKNHNVPGISSSSGHNLTGSGSSAKPSLKTKTELDSCKSGPAKRSPDPGKNLKIPPGPSREVPRSPNSAPGNYLFAVQR